MSGAVATTLATFAIVTLPFVYARLVACLIGRAFLPKRRPGAFAAHADVSPPPHPGPRAGAHHGRARQGARR